MSANLSPDRFYLSFSWGGCRLTRANDEANAVAEAIQAAEATESPVNLLASDLKVLGIVHHTAEGWRFEKPRQYDRPRP